MYLEEVSWKKMQEGKGKAEILKKHSTFAKVIRCKTFINYILLRQKLQVPIFYTSGKRFFWESRVLWKKTSYRSDQKT